MVDQHPFVERLRRAKGDLAGPRDAGRLWLSRVKPTDLELDRFCREADRAARIVLRARALEGVTDHEELKRLATADVKTQLRRNRVQGLRSIILTWLIGFAVQLIVEWIIDQLFAEGAIS